MYQRYYDLRELPFELTSDPRYLVCTPTHREALNNLQYGLAGAKAITVLIGEAGTGKTTVLRAALESEACRHVQHVYISNPALTRGEFIQSLASSFGLSADAASSKATLLVELERLLRERLARHITTALVVDEAHSLSSKLLEEVRLLANFETPDRKLLPLVLAGQPELASRLNEPGLRQLKQRVALRCELRQFTAEETAEYIASRIRTAGGRAANLFTREAVMLVHEHSRGIPRIINVLCDNALLNGMALNRRPIGHDIVLDVIRDFDVSLDSKTVEAAAARAPVEPGVNVVPLPEPASETRARKQERGPLRLDDLDAQLEDPEDTAIRAFDIPVIPAAEPRRRFRFLRSGRR